MNPEYEKQLEVEIDQHLRELPELRAPEGLILRVMQELARRAALPWYQQSWERWPVVARWALLVGLAAVFGAACYGSWQLIHSTLFGIFIQQIGSWFSGVAAIWHTLGALVNAIGLVFGKLGTGFIIGCLAALGFGYAMCVGLGTVYIRVGLARR